MWKKRIKDLNQIFLYETSFGFEKDNLSAVTMFIRSIMKLKYSFFF